MRMPRSLGLVGLSVALCLACAPGAAGPGPRSHEIASRVAAHTTPDQKALLERWRASMDASLKTYLEGPPQEAIPSLLRYLMLEVQAQKVTSDILRAAKVEPGLGADAVVASNLALAHGRLANAYLETGNTERCQYHVEKAIAHGREWAVFYAKDFSGMLGDSAGEVIAASAMDTPEKVFAAVRRMDETLRPGKAFQPVRTNCSSR